MMEFWSNFEEKFVLSFLWWRRFGGSRFRVSFFVLGFCLVLFVFGVLRIRVGEVLVVFVFVE